MLLKQIKHVNRTGFISKIRLIIFLKKVRQYCVEQKYDFVWFCKDVEQVYIGKKVDDSQKKKEAAKFKARKQISTVDSKKLLINNYQINTSNIMSVLDHYLELRRKR